MALVKHLTSDPFPVKCFSSVDTWNQIKPRTGIQADRQRPKVSDFFMRHRCPLTSALLTQSILLHGSLGSLNRPLLSQEGGWRREMNFTRKKGLSFQLELQRFHYGSTGSAGLSFLVIIFLFKESPIHAPASPGLCHNNVFFIRNTARISGIIPAIPARNIKENTLLSCAPSLVASGWQMVAPGQTKTQIQPLMKVHQVQSCFFYQPT